MIVLTIISLPGYHKYCDHQSNIKQRAKDWARCAEKMYVPSQKRPTQEDIAEHRGIFRSRYSETMNSDVFDKKHPIKTEYARKKEEETRNRIIDVLLICQRKGKKYPNFKSLLTDVNLTSKEKYGIGTGYNTLQKYKAYWSVLVDGSTTEPKINTDTSTDNNSNTNQSNSETLEKLIFSDCSLLQNTTATENQAIQQLKKSSNENSQTPDTKTNTVLLAIENLEKNLDTSNPTVVSDSTTQTPKSKVTSQTRFIGGRRWGGESEKADKSTGDSETKKPQTTRTRNRRPKKEYPETLLSAELLNQLNELEIPLDSQLIKKLSESSQFNIDSAISRFKQIKHNKIKNPAAWMMAALTDGYQPHEFKYSNVKTTNNRPDPTPQTLNINGSVCTSEDVGLSADLETKIHPSRENWDGKLKITSEFLSFFEQASKIPGFLKEGQDPYNPPGSNSFHEPRIYISDQAAFLNGVKGRWYLCDWITAAKDYLPLALSKLNQGKEEAKPLISQPLKPGKENSSEDFLRFWEVAQKTEGFLKPGQNIDKLIKDGYDQPQVYISEKIASKYLPPRSEKQIKMLLKIDADMLNWRHCEWKKAQRYLEDLLDF